MRVLSPASLEYDGPGERTHEDRAAVFVELYRTQFEYVWQSAHRLGVRAEEVDDVVQETFLTVHRLMNEYEHRGSIRGWLFSIGWDSEASFETVPESSAHGPDRIAEAEQDARRLEAILDKLNPEQRAVLVLTEIEERPVTEVAEILGINIYTARSRLRLAREHVATSLERQTARDRWRLK
mgnify:CR=1 FL=1